VSAKPLPAVNIDRSWRAASARAWSKSVVDALNARLSATVVADDFDWYLLIGNETALPAIGRWLGELRADTHAIALIEIQDAGEQQLESQAALTL
jgi:NADPH-dependent ferric siderophore reductase